METPQEDWSRTVFRLQRLPTTVVSRDDVARLLGEALGDVRPENIRVFSVATTLNSWETPRSKVATVMFNSTPSIITKNNGEKQWLVPRGVVDAELLLDVHFLGMTPLNEVDSGHHKFDCIAISGLASHPFGSWQPRGGDKTFMWIRDALPHHLRNVRTVIYGYDTTLENSQSFQLIPDLARALIVQLETYGWNGPTAKPIAFLGHSLGGLVLRESLVQLANGPGEVYRNILSVIRGAVFFGVPNLGMEQAHIRSLTKNNPNESLVDDLARNSNYLRRLNESFLASQFHRDFKSFWAYETAESPTVRKLADGRVDRNGPPAILVSRESATCRYVESNQSITLPIDMGHSEMVKFAPESIYYHAVLSKLSTIISPSFESENNNERNSVGRNDSFSGPLGHEPNVLQVSKVWGLKSEVSSAVQAALSSRLSAVVEAFVRRVGLTEDERADYQTIDYESLKGVIRKLQEEQGHRGGLMDMNRLGPFLISMEKYGEVVQQIIDEPAIMYIVWGSMKHILDIAFTFPEALNAVLDGYQSIGDQLASFVGFQQAITNKPYMRDILIMMYEDILEFHGGAIRCLKQRQWKQFFNAGWRDLEPRIEHITESVRRHRWLIEAEASISQFEEIQNSRDAARRAFEAKRRQQEHNCLMVVKQWLSPFGSETELDHHRNTRSICGDPGRWLFEHRLFQTWFSTEYCSTPLLWLSGIPGAGKTILASVIIDAARVVQGATVLFFFCKHGDDTRNSFISVARSILAQILSQHFDLLPYFHEKATMSGDAVLSSSSVAKEMIRTTLHGTERTYIVIDGLDECERNSRKEISNWFRELVESLPPAEMDSIRCLFVSQDDGIARKDLGRLPTLKITTENEGDLKAYAEAQHREMEAKFGLLRDYDCHIANILCARARGMFIFAEMLAKYLQDQPHRRALLDELLPSKLPVKLDHVYKRILKRVLESRGENLVGHLRQVLAWIVSAKRPLRWREIQGAICIDLDRQCVDWDRKLLDSPKELFCSLVELQTDDTIELIHQTAHEYLIREKVFTQYDMDYSLSMLSLAYLSLPPMCKKCDDDDIAANILKGTYAFYDYASACWSIHLQAGVLKPDAEDRMELLLETTETFIECHRSSTSKPLADSKKLLKSISSFQTSGYYDQIVQAVAWSRRQIHGGGPNENDALDLWQVSAKIRSVLEAMHSQPLSEVEVQKLQTFYGTNWFKCPRLGCEFYHHGFSTSVLRDQHSMRHDRPFLCSVVDCHMATFGCTKEDDLKKHLFDYHGIDMSDNVEFPAPPKQPSSTAKHPATFECHICPKKFTRRHNLNAHLNTHTGEKPFECLTCGERFTRKGDCDRHERGHGDKTYTCFGRLKDRSPWGCKATFSRADKLADHFRSKRGRKCIETLVLEKLRQGGDAAAQDIGVLDGQVGPNTEALLAAGKLLPSFGAFLQLCGLDKDSLLTDTNSPSNSPASSLANYGSSDGVSGD